MKQMSEFGRWIKGIARGVQIEILYKEILLQEQHELYRSFWLKAGSRATCNHIIKITIFIAFQYYIGYFWELRFGLRTASPDISTRLRVLRKFYSMRTLRRCIMIFQGVIISSNLFMRFFKTQIRHLVFVKCRLYHSKPEISDTKGHPPPFRVDEKLEIYFITIVASSLNREVAWFGSTLATSLHGLVRMPRIIFMSMQCNFLVFRNCILFLILGGYLLFKCPVF